MDYEKRPLSPNEVQQKWTSQVPGEIFEAINSLLVEKWHGNESQIFIYQKEIIDRVNIPKDEIYKNHWLDIEPFYEEMGWTVLYDQPAYCESYESNFTFKPWKL